MNELTKSRLFNEEDYKELLRQAVAVIESSRLRIAKQLNTVAISHIGRLANCWKKKS